MAGYLENINKTKGLMQRMGQIPVERHTKLSPFNFFLKTGKIPLDEGFIRSYNANFVVSSLISHYGMTLDESTWRDGSANGYISVDLARVQPKTIQQLKGIERPQPINDEFVVITIATYFEKVPNMEDFMKACGWYLSEDIWENDVHIITFEKHFQEEVDYVYNGNYLYHLTPQLRVNKILKIGLSPKSNSKMAYHPERIYLFPEEPTPHELLVWINQLGEFEKYPSLEKGYSLLKIDKSKCNIKLYADPNMDGGVFTTDNIPPQAITIEKETI